MVEDNDTKENGLNFGRKIELEEIIVRKMINMLIHSISHDTSKTESRRQDLKNIGSVEES